MDRPTLRSRLFVGHSNSLLVGTFFQYARSAAFGALRRGLTKGQLTMEDDDGEHVFGKVDSAESESVRLTVVNNAMWGQIFISHDIGFAEAYMQGHFEVSDLKGLLDLWLDNRTGLGVMSSTLSSTFQLASSILNNIIFKQNIAITKQSAVRIL
ncbi:hypothetical protein B0H19DRAFT_1251337 [Mycena capillaripes]|nr:hypothetical protein B0H19DRAFT_1251337 [Mycena capillaripes]